MNHNLYFVHIIFKSFIVARDAHILCTKLWSVICDKTKHILYLQVIILEFCTVLFFFYS